MRPSLSYFILYLGIEGKLDGLSVSNNEVFSGDPFQKEYQSLYENRIPEEGLFLPTRSIKGQSISCAHWEEYPLPQR